MFKLHLHIINYTANVSVALSLLELLIRPGGYSGSGVGSIDTQPHCLYGQPSLDHLV